MITPISFPFLKIKSVNVNTQNSYYQNRCAQTSDTFERTTNPITSNDMGIEVIGNVSEQVQKDFTKKIKSFPKKWLQLFKENNYKIVLTDNIEKICREYNILKNKTISPTNVFGLTYTDGKNRNFFIFSGKTPSEHIGKVVNHEFGHGICNINHLDSDSEYRELLSSDVSGIISNRKLDKLSVEERACLSHYFFNSKASLPVDEIIADLIAWNQPDGGCYGSGLIQNNENIELMPSMFPKLFDKISSTM